MITIYFINLKMCFNIRTNLIVSGSGFACKLNIFLLPCGGTNEFLINTTIKEKRFMKILDITALL